jgi:hypothetical protein
MSFLIILVIVQAALGVTWRAYTILVERGCGWWVLAAVWQTAFTVIRVPTRLIRSTVHDVLEPVYEAERRRWNGYFGRNDPNNPAYGDLHPDRLAANRDMTYKELSRRLQGIDDQNDLEANHSPERPPRSIDNLLGDNVVIEREDQVPNAPPAPRQ